ncbi:hypothetical protein C4D60_Mb05t05700 [Musa balbisiana]|uniref:Uncharacterized protein n=1 Tax=Musa balbisiana TaxID=52838 RepID=A0A4V4H7X8_MUSBA|nr:hypothetical protein C4D60_Mb05t05700 [Musa balbisiana]
MIWSIGPSFDSVFLTNGVGPILIDFSTFLLGYNSTSFCFPLSLLFNLLCSALQVSSPSCGHELTSLGHARTAMREADRWKNEYSTPSSMGYFPRISPSAEHDEEEKEEEEFSSVYGVSKRLVPQGPNPLHN